MGKVARLNPYFVQSCNAVGQLGFTPTRNYVVAIKMLANEEFAYALDDHLKFGESIILKTLKKFVETIMQVYGAEWLRSPMQHEMEHILKDNAVEALLAYWVA